MELAWPAGGSRRGPGWNLFLSFCLSYFILQKGLRLPPPISSSYTRPNTRGTKWKHLILAFKGDLEPWVSHNWASQPGHYCSTESSRNSCSTKSSRSSCSTAPGAAPACGQSCSTGSSALWPRQLHAHPACLLHLHRPCEPICLFWVSHSVSVSRLDWCDPGEWWYLQKNLLMKTKMMKMMKMLKMMKMMNIKVI